MNRRLFNDRDLVEYTGMSKPTAIKLAQEAGAMLRFGGRVCYDRVRLDAYIDAASEVKSEEL